MKSVGVKILSLIFFFFSGIAFAQTPYEVTKEEFKRENKLVHDFGNIFSPEEKNQLENKLVAYDDSTSVQIVIVTFKNLDGYPISLLGSEIGEKWGVGQKDTHNGVVIVVSDEDRKVTIRGGYGVQAKMPPSIEKLIIDREMIPSFKNGNYYQGLDNAINAIQQQLAGQYQAKPKSSSGNGGGILVFLFFLFVIIIFIIIASKGGGGGGGNRSKRGFNWGDVIFTSGGTRSWGGGSSWGGGGSFGGSGGGFGGFGGGSFGGGGASGSW